MSLRPVIFLSAVSRELKSARQLVANTVTFLGYEPDWEDIFGSGEGDLLGELRRRIDASAGVIQLVGRCYGAEPSAPDGTFGRASFTQYEAFYARQRGKKVWYLLLGDGFPTDLCDPELEEIAQLQQAYRARVRADGHLFHPVASDEGLEASVLKLRDDLTRLRRGAKQRAALVLALLVLLVAGLGWLEFGQKKQGQWLAQVTEQTERVAEKSDRNTSDIARIRQAIRDLSLTLAQTRQAGVKEDEDVRFARAYSVLEEKQQLPAGTLQEEVPKVAHEVLASADTSALDRAYALFATRKFADAEAAALKAKEEILAAAGQPAEAIKAWELAGQSALEQIRYTRALDHYRAASALTSQERDPEEWARVQHMLAYLLITQGRAREVEPMLRTVILERESALGAEHPDTLASRNNLAAALQALGKNAAAEKQLRAVLEIRKRVLGAEHPDTLTSWNNLAAALQAQRRNPEAEQELRAVLPIMERVLGAEHPDTLRTRNNLAEALRGQGRYSDAERELRQWLPVMEGVLGAKHPDTLTSRMNLATALDGQGKLDEAEAEHRAVLEIKESVLGAEHPDTLASRMNLANVLDEEGRYVEAKREYEAVVEMEARVLGPKCPAYLETCYNFALCLAAQEERVLSAARPDPLKSCTDLALCLTAQVHFEEALVFMKRAEQGRTEVLGSGDADTGKARQMRLQIEAKLKDLEGTVLMQYRTWKLGQTIWRAKGPTISQPKITPVGNRPRARKPDRARASR